MEGVREVAAPAKPAMQLANRWILGGSWEVQVVERTIEVRNPIFSTYQILTEEKNQCEYSRSLQKMGAVALIGQRCKNVCLLIQALVTIVFRGPPKPPCSRWSCVLGRSTMTFVFALMTCKPEMTTSSASSTACLQARSVDYISTVRKTATQEMEDASSISPGRQIGASLQK